MSELEELKQTVLGLRAVCAEAYQLAGAFGAPVEALDNLSAAANGDPIPHETFLPVLGSNRLLKAIENLTGDEWACDLEWDAVAHPEKLSDREKEANRRLCAIYRLSHSHNTDHSCYKSHDIWRKELDAHEIKTPGQGS